VQVQASIFKHNFLSSTILAGCADSSNGAGSSAVPGSDAHERHIEGLVDPASESRAAISPFEAHVYPVHWPLCATRLHQPQRQR
jgi:hypothetical protein